MRRGRGRVRDAIEVRSPSVDAERLFKSVEASMAARRSSFSEGRIGYVPSYDDLLDPPSEAAAPRSEAEYYLRRLHLSDVCVTPDVRPCNAPFVGPILDLFKRQFHNLVLYYVNILAGKQAHHNAHMVRMVTVLTKETARLRAELEKMRAREGRSLPEKDGQQ